MNERLDKRTTIFKLLESKSVSFFPGLCLLINALTGPSIPFTSNLFQTAGFIPVLFLFLLFAVLSTFSSLFLVEAIQAIPGNTHFMGHTEFATVINFYFDGVFHLVGQFCLYSAVMSNAIQCIALSTQSFDNVLVELFKYTAGLSFNGEWKTATVKGSFPSPFGDQLMIFTLGFLIVIVFAIPMLYVDLESNLSVQIISFIMGLLMMSQWVISAILYIFYNPNSKQGSVPVFSSNSKAYQQLSGNVMLSLAFTFVVPSWINLKKRNVSTQGTLWTTSFLATILYCIVGWIRILKIT